MRFRLGTLLVVAALIVVVLGLSVFLLLQPDGLLIGMAVIGEVLYSSQFLGPPLIVAVVMFGCFITFMYLLARSRRNDEPKDL